MKHILGIAALSALVTMSGMGVGQAAPVNEGTFTGQIGANSNSFGASTAGAFNDLFTFTLTQQLSVAISVTNGFSNASQVFDPFLLELYDNASGTGTALKFANATTNVADSRQTASLTDILALGTYSFRVSGDSSNSPSYGGSISVSPVPLPASAPLFGAAVLLLGVVGYRAKHKKAVSTAV